MEYARYLASLVRPGGHLYVPPLGAADLEIVGGALLPIQLSLASAEAYRIRCVLARRPSSDQPQDDQRADCSCVGRWAS